jgi:hypothetical protein
LRTGHDSAAGDDGYRAGNGATIADISDAFGSELDAGQQSALISWLAFTGTFSGVRGVLAGKRHDRGIFAYADAANLP